MIISAVFFECELRRTSGALLTFASSRAQLRQMTLLPAGSVVIVQQSPQTMPWHEAQGPTLRRTLHSSHIPSSECSCVRSWPIRPLSGHLQRCYGKSEMLVLPAIAVAFCRQSRPPFAGNRGRLLPAIAAAFCRQSRPPRGLLGATLLFGKYLSIACYLALHVARSPSAGRRAPRPPNLCIGADGTRVCPRVVGVRARRLLCGLWRGWRPAVCLPRG